MSTWKIEATITVEAETRRQAIEKLNHALQTKTTALCCKPHENTDELTLHDWTVEQT